MSLRTDHRGILASSPPLNVLLLAGAGLVLFIAWALIALEAGSFISLGDNLLATIAQCF
jgi:hypothetical protein